MYCRLISLCPRKRWQFDLGVEVDSMGDFTERSARLKGLKTEIMYIAGALDAKAGPAHHHHEEGCHGSAGARHPALSASSGVHQRSVSAGSSTIGTLVNLSENLAAHPLAEDACPRQGAWGTILLTRHVSTRSKSSGISGPADQAWAAASSASRLRSLLKRTRLPQVGSEPKTFESNRRLE